VAILQGPRRPPRQPNCELGDPVDALGLVHDWQLHIDGWGGDLYVCGRCRAVDYD
jgi:hypothetical protein